MLRLKGRVLNLEERSGVNKEGKPYYGASITFIDLDNDVHLVRVFDRDGSLVKKVKGIKIGEEVEFKVDKSERLTNRTFDTIGQFV